MTKIRINHELLHNSYDEEVEMDANHAEPSISANDYELIDFDGVYETKYGLRYHLVKQDKQINR